MESDEPAGVELFVPKLNKVARPRCRAPKPRGFFQLVLALRHCFFFFCCDYGGEQLLQRHPQNKRGRK